MKEELTENEIGRIKAEVERGATEHLNAKDAAEALSHYTEDVIAVSNDKLFASFEALAEDVVAYHDILKEVNLAVWDQMYIKVINSDAAIFTTKFRYSFTSTDNERTDLQGVWTALFVRSSEGWKIRVRHESFTTLGG